MVRVILVLITTPVKIRPLIETVPVNGHFLSMYVPSTAYSLFFGIKLISTKNLKVEVSFYKKESIKCRSDSEQVID